MQTILRTIFTIYILNYFVKLLKMNLNACIFVPYFQILCKKYYVGVKSNCKNSV